MVLITLNLISSHPLPTDPTKQVIPRAALLYPFETRQEGKKTSAEVNPEINEREMVELWICKPLGP